MPSVVMGSIIVTTLVWSLVNLTRKQIISKSIEYFMFFSNKINKLYNHTPSKKKDQEKVSGCLLIWDG